jgi:hypothetical protein
LRVPTVAACLMKILFGGEWRVLRELRLVHAIIQDDELAREVAERRNCERTKHAARDAHVERENFRDDFFSKCLEARYQRMYEFFRQILERRERERGRERQEKRDDHREALRIAELIVERQIVHHRPQRGLALVAHAEREKNSDHHHEAHRAAILQRERDERESGHEQSDVTLSRDAFRIFGMRCEE